MRCFDNFGTQEFKVDKNLERSGAEGKVGKCGNRILHTSYQLPEMLSIFQLIIYLYILITPSTIFDTLPRQLKNIYMLLVAKDKHTHQLAH